jgi:hypothetical protein
MDENPLENKAILKVYHPKIGDTFMDIILQFYGIN